MNVPRYDDLRTPQDLHMVHKTPTPSTDIHIGQRSAYHQKRARQCSPRYTDRLTSRKLIVSQ